MSLYQYFVRVGREEYFFGKNDKNNFAVTTGEDNHRPPALKGQMPLCPCILGQVRSVSVCGFHRDTVEGGDVFQRRQVGRHPLLGQGCFHQDVYSSHARPGAWERETRDRRRETVEMRDMALTSIYVQCTTWWNGKFELAIAGCARLGANREAGRGSCQF